MARGRKKTDKSTISIRLTESTESKLNKLVDYFKKDVESNASVNMDINPSVVIEHLTNTETERINLANSKEIISPPTFLKRIDENYIKFINISEELKNKPLNAIKTAEVGVGRKFTIMTLDEYISTLNISDELKAVIKDNAEQTELTEDDLKKQVNAGLFFGIPEEIINRIKEENESDND
ncbi:hypothetical protein ABD87_22630 [Lysinibacillus sphaericus]|uniref:hypothetical protein n=1 Tax=Lysinibacillus sphaericus TaxID=1421 RepID=UPI0018CE31B7|nr:hypothetical protein [Lysinibacillus sphaericus]MBG9732223.1 hypothetical protein [Lysinibacillus sphaericus]